MKMKEKGFLIINLSSSECGDCGFGADPHEKSHITRLGYGKHPKKGCGAKWTKVTSGYSGMKKRLKEMRPDLELKNLIQPYTN